MSSIDTIQIALEPGLAKALRDSVDAGDDRSIDDAMRDAVRLWQDGRARETQVSIKERIERSQNDTRAGLSSQEVDERLEALFVRSERHNERT